MVYTNRMCVCWELGLYGWSRIRGEGNRCGRGSNCHWVKIYGTYAPAARESRPGVPVPPPLLHDNARFVCVRRVERVCDRRPKTSVMWQNKHTHCVSIIIICMLLLYYYIFSCDDRCFCYMVARKTTPSCIIW